MVLKPDTIEQRLKELNRILQELKKYEGLEPDVLRQDLSQRWIIERGLIAAASIILDIADHILAGHFGIYVETYEESLEELQNNEVISAALYQQIKGLGGFRNLLVHDYLGLDTAQVFDNFQKGLLVFPLFAQEILEWLDAQGLSA
jgi:uncharacterized protein YutE (UPF0331/DUF86 family)